MKMLRPYTDAITRLRDAGLRPTRQRMALVKLLVEGGERHLTAEQLHCEALGAGIPVSLATIYNSLHQFTEAGLLREIIVDSGRSYFDTNVSDHHHFFYENSGRLEDIPADQVELSRLPQAPNGATIARIDVIVRIRD